MAKAKPENGTKRVPNRHMYARMSYLHQVAQHLAASQVLTERMPEATFTNGPGAEMQVDPPAADPRDTHGNKQTHSEKSMEQISDMDVHISNDNPELSQNIADGSGLSRLLASHILSVSRKGNVRVSRELKRSICKRCTSVLIPGHTADHKIENKSRGGHKICADVLVVTCSACGFEKRYPFGAQKQPRKKDRVASKKNVVNDTTRDLGQGDG